MLSHGFLPRFVNEKHLKEVNTDIKRFFLTDKSNENYYSDLHIKIPNVKKLINKKILEKVKKLLNCLNPQLCNIELHRQSRNNHAIPAHQDNFYHCIEPYHGLKILIPLQEMNNDSGALTFLDSDVNFPLQAHESSKIRNFSSYIPKNIFNKLNLGRTCYEYKLCDASYHFLNSIHFSDGNKTNKDIYFLVFRFQNPKAKVDELALSRYSNCLKKHNEILNNNF